MFLHVVWRKKVNVSLEDLLLVRVSCVRKSATSHHPLASLMLQLRQQFLFDGGCRQCCCQGDVLPHLGPPVPVCRVCNELLCPFCHPFIVVVVFLSALEETAVSCSPSPGHTCSLSPPLSLWSVTPHDSLFNIEKESRNFSCSSSLIVSADASSL